MVLNQFLNISIIIEMFDLPNIQTNFGDHLTTTKYFCEESIIIQQFS